MTLYRWTAATWKTFLAGCGFTGWDKQYQEHRRRNSRRNLWNCEKYPGETARCLYRFTSKCYIHFYTPISQPDMLINCICRHYYLAANSRINCVRRISRWTNWSPSDFQRTEKTKCKRCRSTRDWCRSMAPSATTTCSTTWISRMQATKKCSSPFSTCCHKSWTKMSRRKISLRRSKRQPTNERLQYSLFTIVHQWFNHKLCKKWLKAISYIPSFVIRLSDYLFSSIFSCCSCVFIRFEHTELILFYV